MSEEKKPFHNPFAALRGKLQNLPQGPAPQTAAPPLPRPAPQANGPARAVVRLERKGRRGKEVTVIEQLELKPSELGAWLKSLKSALGCGGAAESGSIVLQGDQRKRLPEILSARGVRKVILG